MRFSHTAVWRLLPNPHTNRICNKFKKSILIYCRLSLMLLLWLSRSWKADKQTGPRFLLLRKSEYLCTGNSKNLQQHFSLLSDLFGTSSPSPPSTSLYNPPPLITAIFLIFISFLHFSPCACFHQFSVSVLIFHPRSLSVLLVTDVLSLGRVQFHLILCSMRRDWCTLDIECGQSVNCHCSNLASSEKKLKLIKCLNF